MNCLDVRHFFSVVKIYLDFLFNVDIQAILGWSEEEFCLVLIKVSIAWILVTLVVNLVEYLYLKRLWVLIIKFLKIVEPKHCLFTKEFQVIVVINVKVKLNAGGWEWKFKSSLYSKRAVMIFFVDNDVIYLLLIPDHVPTKSHSDLFLILRYNQVENLNVRITCWNKPLLFHDKIWLIGDDYLVL